MKVFIAIALCALAAVGNAQEFEELVATVNNNPKSSWKAELPTRFNSTADAKILCGTWLKDHPKYMRLPERKYEDNYDYTALPTSFDARTAHSNCTVISKVRDQSSCGSCWAFGSTESFEDRRCIATGKDVEFSTEDTASCCRSFACGFSMGCNGGQPSAALQWMAKTGVVTGGDYPDIGSGSSCRPYTLKPCAHHVPATPKYAKCPTSEYPTPKCAASCSEPTYPKS